MATVIDLSILSSMSIIIVFVLVFVGSWGLLMLVDPFKDKGKSLYGIIAFMLALLMVISKGGVAVVMTATPWLMVLGMIGFFFIFFAKMFGRGDADISKAFGAQFGWVILFVAIILLFAVGSALGPGLLAKQQPGSPTAPVVVPGDSAGAGNFSGLPADSIQRGTATGDFGTNLVYTIFHPKILGVLFLFILGTLTIIMIGKN